LTSILLVRLVKVWSSIAYEHVIKSTGAISSVAGERIFYCFDKAADSCPDHAIVSENNGVILSQFGHTNTVGSSDPKPAVLTEMSAS
jgi:hypothetical protein